MYNIHDTIAAVSSAAGTDAMRNIIRISGSEAFKLAGRVFESSGNWELGGVTGGSIHIDNELTIDVTAYIFVAPHSYTGEDVIELHICGPTAAVDDVMRRLFALGVRAAGPGEFTARAYLNGKMDLAQAEAVAQIVAGSNEMQLTAAQKLLAGKLAQTIHSVQGKLLELISRIEAGLDFAGEDIEFISPAAAIKEIEDCAGLLRQLLDGSVNCEEMISLPAVGIVGVSNAGKSSLLNALLGQERSIVSGDRATTRDVLTGILKLPHCACAIFDCAGLSSPIAPKDILEQLAQNAALEAIRTAQLVIFCADVTKPSWPEDVEIFELLRAKHVSIIAAATKCDVPEQNILAEKIAAMEAKFSHEFLATSSVSSTGIESVRTSVDTVLTGTAAAIAETADIISLNQRHRKWLCDAISNLCQAKQELMSDNVEVAAMLLRNGYRAFGELSDEGIDDAVLDRIFSRFCIGK